MTTLQHLMAGLPRRMPPGAPWGAPMGGQAFGFANMPSGVSGLPGGLPGPAALPGAPRPQPGMPGVLPNMPPMPQQPRPAPHSERRQHVPDEPPTNQGRPLDREENLQDAEWQHGLMMLTMKAAQRVGRMPRDLKELLQIMHPAEDEAR